jgi:hypothetical protein
VNLLRDTAASVGRACEIQSCLCEGAYEAVVAGDTATHDRILWEKLTEVAGRADVIVLAQASMAGVLTRMPSAQLGVPVLSSPEPAVRDARDVLLFLTRDEALSAAGARR